MNNIEKAVSYARDTIINRDCIDVLDYINNVANMYSDSYNNYMDIYHRLIAIFNANN